MADDHKKKDDTEDLLPDSFDGIREKKGRVPVLFSFVFIATIVFAFGYFTYYEVLGKGGDATTTEATVAAVSPGAFDYVGHLKDANLIAEGKTAYQSTCASCHGAQLQGSVGPNLVDDAWMAGDTYPAVEKSIADGISGTGMPAWKSMLSHEKIQAIVVYIASLQGSHPEGALPAQGSVGHLH